MTMRRLPLRLRADKLVDREANVKTQMLSQNIIGVGVNVCVMYYLATSTQWGCDKGSDVAHLGPMQGCLTAALV